MTKVVISDCSIARQSSSSLKTDGEDSNIIKKSIDSFVTESPDKLSGDVYDKIRNSFNAISPLLTERQNVANSLSEAIDKVNKLFENYLGGDSVIDNSNIDQVKSNLDIAYANLCNFTGFFKFLNRDYRSCQATYDALEAQYNRLLELDRIDQEAVGILNEVAEQILSFSNHIGSYETDKVTVQL